MNDTQQPDQEKVNITIEQLLDRKYANVWVHSFDILLTYQSSKTSKRYCHLHSRL